MAKKTQKDTEKSKKPRYWLRKEASFEILLFSYINSHLNFILNVISRCQAKNSMGETSGKIIITGIINSTRFICVQPKVFIRMSYNLFKSQLQMNQLKIHRLTVFHEQHIALKITGCSQKKRFFFNEMHHLSSRLQEIFNVLVINCNIKFHWLLATFWRPMAV